MRQALYYAMDKQSIIDAIYYGLPKPTEILPAAAVLGLQSRTCRSTSTTREKAKQLLDEAGWKPGADGVREKDGVRLEFTNSTTAGNHVREQAQQFLQQNWQRHRRRDDDQQHAAGGDVGRLLDAVEVRHAPWSASAS